MELAIIGVTLAFVCFMGGYLTGRSTGVVSIAPATASQVPAASAPLVVSVQQEGTGAHTDYLPEIPEVVSILPPGGDALYTPSLPLQPPQTPAPPSSRDSEGRLNINIASRSELMDLPGIGPSLSERIVQYRELHGHFSRIDDLRHVTGIGERRFEAIMNIITVG